VALLEDFAHTLMLNGLPLPEDKDPTPNLIQSSTPSNRYAEFELPCLSVVKAGDPTSVPS